jgi:hypothetical protein
MVLNLFMETDWRTAGRWGSYGGLPSLLAGDGLTPLPVPRFVWRLACLHCEQLFLSADDQPQSCPQCQRRLQLVAKWDLCRERDPRWWRDAPGSGELP